MSDLIETTDEILIFSGEGEGPEHMEKYTGKRTMRAIRSRLTRERCSGDRWAVAMAYSHTNDHGDVYVNIETGTQRVEF